MRGIPNNPVKCICCGRMNGCIGDRLCHSCRMKGRPPVGRKFIWTVELDIILRRAYRGARTRAELSTNLNSLQKSAGFTRNVILGRAVQLGLAFSTRRPWTTGELQILEDRAGQARPKALAVKLNRSHGSVKAKMKELGLSARMGEGYTQDDLRQLLGVSARSIKKWLALGWLRLVQERIPETSVIKFLRLHSEEYHLGRVDQAWFKGLLFPAFNSAAQRPGNASYTSAERPVVDPRTDLRQPYVPSGYEPEMGIA